MSVSRPMASIAQFSKATPSLLNFARQSAAASRTSGLTCCCGTPIYTQRVLHSNSSYKPTNVRQALRSRGIHTSRSLRALPKEPLQRNYNPNPNLDRFENRAGKRKYDLFKLRSYREAYNESPKMFVFAIIMLIGGITSLTIAGRYFYLEFYKRLHNYPEPVAKHIRRAMFYSQNGEIDKSLNSLQTAIRTCMALDMDPLSDEVTGLKIQFAEAVERVGVYDKAVEYLEKLRKEMLVLMEERAEEIEPVARLKLMKRVIGCAVKIGELLLLSENESGAEKAFEWSLAETIKLMNFQSSLKPEEERPWSMEEFAAVFETMASAYEKSNKFEYASTLYIQALSFFQPPTCHSVILLNNIGASNMQRKIPSSQPMDRNVQLESAKKWCLKALDIAANIKPPVRTEECDQGCIVALHNIGEMEEQLGNLDEAKAKYEEAESLSWAIHWVDGYQNAGFALQRIKQRETGVVEEPAKEDASEQKQKEDEETAGGLPPMKFKGDGR